MSEKTQQPAVEMFFDPTCPWAWMTSRWMGEVQQRRDVEVDWRIISLGILNENNPDNHHHGHDESMWLVRVIQAAAEQHGAEYYKNANDQILLVAQIDTRKPVHRLARVEQERIERPMARRFVVAGQVTRRLVEPLQRRRAGGIHREDRRGLAALAEPDDAEIARLHPQAPSARVRRLAQALPGSGGAQRRGEQPL